VFRLLQGVFGAPLVPLSQSLLDADLASSRARRRRRSTLG
jgi:hypothetical protein